MPPVQFGVGSYDHEDYGLPPIVLENWYSEIARDRADKGVRLIPTPGAVEFADTSGGRGRGLFSSDGFLAGEVIAARGEAVYRVNSVNVATQLTGTAADDGYPVSFAISQTPELIMAAGGSTYVVSGSAITSFTWSGPTGNIIGVAEINQRHLYLEAGSGRVWYSVVADATNVSATAFFTAEREPDQLLAVKTQGDAIFLAGTQTTEIAAETGDPNFPFRLRPGGAIPIGIIGRSAITAGPSGVYMVGVGKDEGPQVYDMTTFRPQRISTHPIERALSKLSRADQAKVMLSGYGDSGHSYIQLSMPGKGDWFYDTRTGNWHRRRGLGRENYRYGHYIRAFGKLLAMDTTEGESQSGRIVELSNQLFTDAGNIERRVATAIVAVQNKTPIRNFILEGQGGVGLDGAQQGDDPVAMLRVAHDGRSFGTIVSRPIGKLGNFGIRPTWGNMGIARASQVVFELAISEPIGYSLYGATVNEAP